MTGMLAQEWHPRMLRSINWPPRPPMCPLQPRQAQALTFSLSLATRTVLRRHVCFAMVAHEPNQLLSGRDLGDTLKVGFRITTGLSQELHCSCASL